MKVRQVVTGYDGAGNTIVSSDTVLTGGVVGPAGRSTRLWTIPTFPPPLHDDGQQPGQGAAQWFLVDVPPDKDRGVDDGDIPAGLLHEKASIDLIIMLSGEIWLELEGVKEWVPLRAGDTLVQRATCHAWHNLTDATARFATVIFRGERTGSTPAKINVEGKA